MVPLKSWLGISLLHLRSVPPPRPAVNRGLRFSGHQQHLSDTLTALQESMRARISQRLDHCRTTCAALTTISLESRSSAGRTSLHHAKRPNQCDHACCPQQDLESKYEVMVWFQFNR